ncbi:MAG: 4Fe-4S dicluster domain-containing protein [Candidatus Latescibacteria bacterium]|nr:4Fe-4S dicluster domain-containing protein [Candidatus Latescibacterota bacterium]
MDRAPDDLPEQLAAELEVQDPLDRRAFFEKFSLAGKVLMGIVALEKGAGAEPGYEADKHYYGMGIDVDKCIGCGRCADACKTENDVPREPFFFRTWIERYTVKNNGEVTVESPNGGIDGFPPAGEEPGAVRSFFVPKLCNHCAEPPCVQVCPVGATFSTKEGVVLVDKDYCVGCRYCIQACPYGARFLDPRTGTAEKCTFCYHRLVKRLQPACVEVCPTSARIFGEVGERSSPLTRFTRFNKIQTLKPHLNTESKVFYANLDGEVN